jgi:hypothetical protein
MKQLFDINLVDQELRAAIADMQSIAFDGRFALIGPPSTSSQIAELLAAVPGLPPEVKRWCELCSYASFAWIDVLGPVCRPGGCSLSQYLDVIPVKGRVPIAVDQFGCIYCTDVAAAMGVMNPVFLTDFAAHDRMLYHVASSFPRFLRLVARAVRQDNPDWDTSRAFVLAIDPDLEFIPDVVLPWEVMTDDDELSEDA